MKTILMAGLAALALAAPFAVSAQTADTDSTSAVRVAYKDLDLSQPRQARVMLDRIDRAALEACGASEFSAPQYRAAVQQSACFHDGVGQAVAQTDSPVLSRLYRHNASIEVRSGE